MICPATKFDCITCPDGGCKLLAKNASERLYAPANGNEAESFMSRWCYKCASYGEDDDDEKCRIIAMAFAFRPGDSEYPTEWRHSHSGLPMCTAFMVDDAIAFNPRCPATPDMFGESD